MAGSHGYKFIFGSLIFYLFIALLLGAGAGDFLTADINIPEPVIVEESGNWLYDLIFGGFVWTYNQASTLLAILINPFSAGGILYWLGLAILFTNAYIIVTSIIP